MLYREIIAVCSEIHKKHINTLLNFRRIRKIAKSDYKLLHVRPSVRSHETIWVPLEGFS